MQATATTHTLLANFHRSESGPGWLQELRRESLARFEARGFPTTREEAWRATSVRPIVDAEFRPAGDPPSVDLSDLPPLARLDLGGERLVFLDGHFVPALSTLGPAKAGGPWIGHLADALEQIPDLVKPLLLEGDPEKRTPFHALNGAFVESGAVVLVPAGIELDRPIQLLFGSSGRGGAIATHPRTIVSVARGSRAEVVETYFGLDDGVYLTNSVTDLVIEENADLQHYRIQSESPRAFHLSSFQSRQRRDSRFVSHNFNLGGRLARHDVAAVLDGEGANCELNGLYVTRGEQHVDNHTVLDHAKPHGSSRELYKGILDGRSRSVFNGRIVVRPDAQKTDAKQSNPNLLLSENALAHTRPQLEIYADDVKCTHGATVGQLDEEAIFYLRSRALSRPEAENLLIDAFAGEVVSQVGIEPLRAGLQRAVAERLPGAAPQEA